jgi:hypothetical protein
MGKVKLAKKADHSGEQVCSTVPHACPLRVPIWFDVLKVHAAP